MKTSFVLYNINVLDSFEYSQKWKLLNLYKENLSFFVTSIPGPSNTNKYTKQLPRLLCESKSDIITYQTQSQENWKEFSLYKKTMIWCILTISDHMFTITDSFSSQW
jgi:hypothetical protein